MIVTNIYTTMWTSLSPGYRWTSKTPSSTVSMSSSAITDGNKKGVGTEMSNTFGQTNAKHFLKILKCLFTRQINHITPLFCHLIEKVLKNRAGQGTIFANVSWKHCIYESLASLLWANRISIANYPLLFWEFLPNVSIPYARGRQMHPSKGGGVAVVTSVES